jgi:hypothetical protein
MSSLRLSLLVASLSILAASPVCAAPYFFSTGDPDGLIATASRPDSLGRPEIESADDFVVGQATQISGGSFTGLLTGGVSLSAIGEVVIEIYRVFPLDSDTARTSGPPTFSTAQVPTRVNSPSDVAFASRSSSGAELVSVAAIVAPSFTTANSILNGIHPLPNVFTGGDGAITGQEVRFNFMFSSALTLPADHYFFIPQVQVTGGEFYWLSAPRPIVPPGVPFPPGSTDLQSWIRNDALDPDWLRIGTDITHQGPFNAAFTLSGETVTAVPEPQTYALLVIGFVAMGLFARSHRRRD